MLRYMDLLATKAQKFAHLSGRNQVVVQDLALAMEETGLIRPRSMVDDPHDTDPAGTEGFELFIEWAKGFVPEEQRRISKVPRQGVGTTSAAAAAANANKAAAETSAALESESAATTSAGATTTTTMPSAASAKPIANDTEYDEWLSMLMKKQVKVGQEARFRGTILGPEDSVQNDTVVAGGNEKTSQELADEES
ncbi:hypothetical protein TRVA0_054S00826 [Trichomonascus vanleenenianus]|uniref:uncharacterized protein n=1 Tax=Trichomonascus vanleenenianus TaxID=2268995 RepID=UPI003ECA8952